ncbi:MAG: hypothetical protein IJJ23_04405 [Clostridia bacterium]|nr:hypothetical protein [Clostridia bacterium]
MSVYPRIYLAIDNCVFYKRFSTPDDWARVIADLGLRYIEASADNELDPLYMGRDYLPGWIKAVKSAESKYGVKVANLYSGHGSYTTLGIAHPDGGVRANIRENFFFPLVETAAALGCGLGFFAHAFDHKTLQSTDSYARYVRVVTEELCRINRHAAETDCGKVGVERMYTPHQYPWRNADTVSLLRDVTAGSGHDFYFTEDLGHHHNKFQIPGDEAILDSRRTPVWLGTDRAFALADEDPGANLQRIREDISQNPHLFSQPEDNDCYEVLRTLGRYSPIIHLQQSNGTESRHLPFTPEQNSRGRIEGHAVLAALKQSYENAPEPGMPDPCDEIYLTLEIFSQTTSIIRDVIRDCKESVRYWRQFVPEDGMRLDQLV